MGDASAGQRTTHDPLPATGPGFWRMAPLTIVSADRRILLWPQISLMILPAGCRILLWPYISPKGAGSELRIVNEQIPS